MINTLNSFQVASFTQSFIASKAGDLVDALLHLKSVTGISTQTLLWLNSGKVRSVTVSTPFSL
jgi:hypothetical protein